MGKGWAAGGGRWRWPEGREGSHGLGGAAADSLTSGNRNLSQAYSTSSTAPSLAMAAPRAGRVHLHRALPWHGMAWHGRERRLSWPGSAQPDAGAVSISLGMLPAGWLGARSQQAAAPSPGCPQAGGGCVCVHTLPVFMEQQDQGSAGQVLPQSGQQNGHSGPARAAAPGRPRPYVRPAG